MKYVLGLDVGIASVGWATLELNTQDEPVRILDLNSRIFEKAEIPKTGESLAAPRRIARGSRRRLRRRRFRISRVKNYLVRHNVITKEELRTLYQLTSNAFSIFELRYQGLTRPLCNDEWSRILIYLAKHRGFQSNRKTIASDDEEGEMLAAVRANEELLKKYRTVGEMLCLDSKFSQYKHNKDGNYGFTVSRAMLLNEIKILFAQQRQFGSTFAIKALEDEYVELFSAQRNFDEGPGINSPYSGNQIEKMIGYCTFEKDERRAPKASYAFMAFNLWQKINHIRVNVNGTYRFLTLEEKNMIADLAWKKEAITFKDIRKQLGLGHDIFFKDIPYTNKEELEDVEKKIKFSWVKEYHTIRRALDKVHKNRIHELTNQELDVIGYAFTAYKNDNKIIEYLLDHHIEPYDVEILVKSVSGFSKFGHLSLKACYKILPFLQNGHIYSEACTAAGYDFKQSNQENINSIPNPVVKRAVSQTLKVIRAIQRKYDCSPVEIHIELARDLARSYAERKKMNGRMQDNQARNEQIKNRLIREFNVLRPTGQDIVKFKLYEQQQCACAYSQVHFNVEKLLHDSTYAEVDHIIPYSRSFDDSYKNKVLVFTDENRQKGNRTPMEYLYNYPERRAKFVTWVQNTIRDYRKRDLLLRENYTAEDEKEWKQRNLSDTQYISKYLYNYLINTFHLEPGYTERKRRIIPVNGGITSYVRKRLGIPKIRENGDLHHAVDAVIIACVTQGVITRISRYSKIKELQYYQNDARNIIDMQTGEVLEEGAYSQHKAEPFPEPWPEFRKELIARVSNDAEKAIQALNLTTYNTVPSIKAPFVSRMPNRKIHGMAHKETTKSSKSDAPGYAVVKKNLCDLTLDKITGEIVGYYNPSSDLLLYQALKNRLQQFGGKGKEAFLEPFFKPKSDGTSGPVVKKVKIQEKSNINVYVHNGNGIADNGNMVRVDVFRINERGKWRYYVVPIYVADTVKKVLPNKAIVKNKPYHEWKEMDDKDFIFSLYANDLIYVYKKKGIKLNSLIKSDDTIPQTINREKGYFYYRGTGIAAASISIINHDKTYGQLSLGYQQLDCIEKYTVDVLGNISKVHYEQRQGFETMKRDIHNFR